MTRSRLEVPSCLCVVNARKISVLPIPDKFETEGDAASNSACGPAYGCLIVKCGYCKAILKVEEGFDFNA